MSYIKPQVECTCDTILPGQQVLRFVIPFLTLVSISALLTHRPGKINQKATAILSHPFLHLGWGPTQYLSWKKGKALAETPCRTETKCNALWLHVEALWEAPWGEDERNKEPSQVTTANREILTYFSRGFVQLCKIHVALVLEKACSGTWVQTVLFSFVFLRKQIA